MSWFRTSSSHLLFLLFLSNKGFRSKKKNRRRHRDTTFFFFRTRHRSTDCSYFENLFIYRKLIYLSLNGLIKVINGFLAQFSLFLIFSVLFRHSVSFLCFLSSWRHCTHIPVRSCCASSHSNYPSSINFPPQNLFPILFGYHLLRPLFFHYFYIFVLVFRTPTKLFSGFSELVFGI